jgi:hypothetical protein
MVEDNVSIFELGALLSDGLIAAQLGLFMVSLLAFAASLALCVLAMRAASTIRRSNVEARDIAAFVERQAVDMRELGERVERARQDVIDREAAVEQAQQRFLASFPAPAVSEGPADMQAPGAALQGEEPAGAGGEAPPAKSGVLFRLMRRR